MSAEQLQRPGVESVRLPFSTRPYLGAEAELNLSTHFFERFYLEPIRRYNPGFTASIYGWEALGDTVSATPLLFTRSPDRVFGNDPLYHVTGPEALSAVTKGLPLLPPVSHPDAGITTHKKSGLHLSQALLSIFVGENPARKSGVFAGQLIDAEQFVGDNMLAKETNDWLYEEVVVKRETPDILYGTPVYELHPGLYDCFAELEQHGTLANTSPENKQWLTETVDKIFNRYLVREGWYQTIQAIFDGSKTMPNFNAETARTAIFYALFDWEKIRDANEGNKPEFESAVVLKLNQHRLNQEFGSNTPVVLGDRDPKTIRFMPYVPANAVEAVYFPTGELTDATTKRLQELNVSVGTVDELPPSVWIAGQTPATVGSWQNVDPKKPLCDIRYSRVYSGNIIDYWRGLINDNQLSFAWDFDIPTDTLKNCLGIESETPLPISDVIPTIRQQRFFR